MEKMKIFKCKRKCFTSGTSGCVGVKHYDLAPADSYFLKIPMLVLFWVSMRDFLHQHFCIVLYVKALHSLLNSGDRQHRNCLSNKRFFFVS